MPGSTAYFKKNDYKESSFSRSLDNADIDMDPDIKNDLEKALYLARPDLPEGACRAAAERISGNSKEKNHKSKFKWKKEKNNISKSDDLDPQFVAKVTDERMNSKQSGK